MRRTWAIRALVLLAVIGLTGTAASADNGPNQFAAKRNACQTCAAHFAQPAAVTPQASLHALRAAPDDLELGLVANAKRSVRKRCESARDQRKNRSPRRRSEKLERDRQAARATLNR